MTTEGRAQPGRHAFLIPVDERGVRTAETAGALRRAQTVLSTGGLAPHVRPWTTAEATLRTLPPTEDDWGTTVLESSPEGGPIAVVSSLGLLRRARGALTEAGFTVRLLESEAGAVAMPTASPQPRWLDGHPLAGWRVLVTRPGHQAPVLERALKRRGGHPIRFPVVRITPPSDPAPLAGAISKLEEYDWLLFTSTNAVRAFQDGLRTAGRDAADLAGADIGAVGPSTAAALVHAGFHPTLVPPRAVGEAFLEALAERQQWNGVRVLLPRAREARDLLPDGLRGLGARVDVVEAYRTVATDPDRADDLRRSLEAWQVDLVTFTSPSTVRAFCDSVGTLGTARAVPIGPVTEQAVRRSGLALAGVAVDHTVDGLVRACEDVAATERG